MMMQMGQMAMQLPQQIGGMLTQAPQQLMQPLQQIMQPLQQLMSAGGKGGTGAAPSIALLGVLQSPLGRRIGCGRGRRHGEGGVTAGIRRPVAAVTGAGQSGRQFRRRRGAPGRREQRGDRWVGARECGRRGHGRRRNGNDGQQRGESGGTGSTLAAPPPLDYDLGEDVDDEW